MIHISRNICFYLAIPKIYCIIISCASRMKSDDGHWFSDVQSSNERFLRLRTIKSSEKEVPIFSTVWICILFTPFFVDLVMTYWENPKNESGNSYQVQTTSGKSKIIDSEGIVRVHFHPAGYLITENKEQKFTSYKMSADQKSVIVKQQFIPISIVENQLVWKEEGIEIRWELEEIDLRKMPLKQDEMNWCFEGIGGF